MADSAAFDYEAQKKALLARLARVEGQIRGVRRMVEEEQGCESVAQQLAAARKALNKAFYQMVSCAIEHEVLSEQEETHGEAHGRLGHLTEVLTRYG